MDDTHKLLLAFIDAMGFEVETLQEPTGFMEGGIEDGRSWHRPVLKTTYKVVQKTTTVRMIEEEGKL